MKNIVIFVLACAVAIGLFVCIVKEGELRDQTAEVDDLALALSMGDTECALKVAAKEDVIRKLTAERDALRLELKAAAAALGVEEAEESVELTVFRERLLEVEKRLDLAKRDEERAKIDRDNLANELAGCRESREILAERLELQIDLADGLRCDKEELVEREKALDKYIDECQRYESELRDYTKALRAELERRPNCCQCHQNHRAEPKPKVKHRRQRP